MEKLEKLADFSLENEKLKEIKGGKAAVGNYTSAGERWDTDGAGVCCKVTWTGDYDGNPGGIIYVGEVYTNTLP